MLLAGNVTFVWLWSHDKMLSVEFILNRSVHNLNNICVLLTSVYWQGSEGEGDPWVRRIAVTDSYHIQIGMTEGSQVMGAVGTSYIMHHHLPQTRCQRRLAPVRTRWQHGLAPVPQQKVVSWGDIGRMHVSGVGVYVARMRKALRGKIQSGAHLWWLGAAVAFQCPGLFVDPT